MCACVCVRVKVRVIPQSYRYVKAKKCLLLSYFFFFLFFFLFFTSPAAAPLSYSRRVFFFAFPLTLLICTLATFCARVVREGGSLSLSLSRKSWLRRCKHSLPLRRQSTVMARTLHACVASSRVSLQECALFCFVANVHVIPDDIERDTRNSLFSAQSQNDDLPGETKAA